jgi:hypothetical protein
MESRQLLPLVALLLSAPVAAAEPSLAGEWDSPLGRVRVEARGESFVGTLVASSTLCPFEAGSEVLRGTLLDDSLAGTVRTCLRGKGCKVKEEWSSAVLLSASGALSGAIHVGAKGCAAPFGRTGGLAFKKAAAGSAPPSAGAATLVLTTAKGAKDEKKARRTRAREVLRDGAAFLNEGSFEAARRRFLEAIEIDDGMPESFNGVGVTWRMRNDLGRALEWYKRALVVDPDFGDAYYNMACVYALQGQKELALRYLQIAALNGYATGDGIDADPDLESLRTDPAYRALVRAKM